MNHPSPGAGAPATTANAPTVHLRRRKRPGERVGVLLIQLAALLSVGTTVGIVVSVLLPALEFFRQVPPGDFLTGTRWAPTFASPTYGVLPLVAGTAWTTLIGLVVAVPLGLGSAIYLAEYAGERSRRRLKPLLELLAGVPSVVYGFFALQFVTPEVLQGWLGLEVDFTNVLAAGTVLGIMIVPTVASLSEDAMSAVPRTLRQGSFAMGANRMQTTLRVVVPAAFSGIAAAVVLGVSRAVGETMILALAAGSKANLSLDPREGMQTMTGFIAQAAGGESPVGSLEYDTLFAVGLLLFVLTLLINMVSIVVVRRVRQVY